jgi:hypothetical protein
MDGEAACWLRLLALLIVVDDWPSCVLVDFLIGGNPLFCFKNRETGVFCSFWFRTLNEMVDNDGTCAVLIG